MTRSRLGFVPPQSRDGGPVFRRLRLAGGGERGRHAVLNLGVRHRVDEQGDAKQTVQEVSELDSVFMRQRARVVTRRSERAQSKRQGQVGVELKIPAESQVLHLTHGIESSAGCVSVQVGEFVDVLRVIHVAVEVEELLQRPPEPHAHFQNVRVFELLGQELGVRVGEGFPLGVGEDVLVQEDAHVLRDVELPRLGRGELDGDKPQHKLELGKRQLVVTRRFLLRLLNRRRRERRVLGAQPFDLEAGRVDISRSKRADCLTKEPAVHAQSFHFTGPKRAFLEHICDAAVEMKYLVQNFVIIRSEAVLQFLIIIILVLFIERHWSQTPVVGHHKIDLSFTVLFWDRSLPSLQPTFLVGQNLRHWHRNLGPIRFRLPHQIHITPFHRFSGARHALPEPLWVMQEEAI
mmetsp:Transcript_12742/g.29337  ORF Transcript_12742/g.29337 Transcript_12742/m.29337 type:complete len:405 (+) Transcript_12742:1273-2487(+)